MPNALHVGLIGALERQADSAADSARKQTGLAWGRSPSPQHDLYTAEYLRRRELRNSPLQASGEPTVVSKAEKARRKALSEGDLKGAAAAEVSLLTAVLEAQFGQAHVEAEQGLIMLQVRVHLWLLPGLGVNANAHIFRLKLASRCNIFQAWNLRSGPR